MEIRRWHYYVIFSCVVLKYLEAKTISLNDVITAESQQKAAFESTLPPKSEGTGKSYSLFKRIRSPSKIQNFLESSLFRVRSPFRGNIPKSRILIPVGNILSPLKYKKTYMIKSPLKPRKLKLSQKSRYKRKNLSAKREINGNEELKQKYIPLLKSLSMLFDNLFNSDSSESYEVKTKKYKRNRFYSEEAFKIPLGKYRSDSGITESQEETVTFSPTITTATSVIAETPTTSEATSTTTNIITTRDFSAFRQHKDIPVLLPRNTSSGRGDDHGIGERSGATLHGNIEGNITRYHGDYEHAAGCGENESCAEDYEKDTHGITRNGTRSVRFPRPIGHRNSTGILLGRNRTSNENNSQTEASHEHDRENQFKNRRNETESGRILQEPFRRLRGFVSKDVNKNTEYVQPKEVREESVIHVSHDNAGYQRVTDGDGPVAEENQKVRTGNETLTTMNNLNYTTSQSNPPKKKSPVMMIFDGYSVVKHKNGQNKFAEKTIRIHS